MSAERPVKRRRAEATNRRENHGPIDITKPSAIFKPSRGRLHTVSVALPSSVVANAQTHDAKTALIGTLARALSVFCVDEIVIFSDGCNALYSKSQSADHAAADARSGYTAFSDPTNFMFHILSYLECPPHLRQSLFGFHSNFRTASALPSLDIPSHARRSEWCRYREGVTVEPVGRKQYADAGLGSPVMLEPSPEETISPNTRVTLKFATDEAPARYTDVSAEAVGPEVPREEGGYYWGFVPRVAEGLAEVFTECPWEGGYDYSIGLSERGSPLKELLSVAEGEEQQSNGEANNGDANGQSPLKTWKHLLIVFGGPPGLEKAASNDSTLREKGVAEASELFDAWVNLMDGQGSRTIRTEEALWIGLMGLWDLIKAREKVDAA